jgi:hypothetical protein
MAEYGVCGRRAGEVIVTLEYELGPKLDEIVRLAEKMYSDYLRAKGLMFDGNGAIQFDLGNSVIYEPPPDLAYENAHWGTVRGNVLSLRARFMAFYHLDPLDFTIMGGTLGGRMQGGLGENPVVSSGATTNVQGAIAFAEDTWVTPIDGMINEGQWSGRAASDFHTQFLKPFESAAEQQMAYAMELRIAVQCFHDAIAHAHDDILAIADKCIAVLSGQHGGGDASGFFTVVSIVTGVISIFPGPHSPVLGTISLGSGIMSGLSGAAAGENTTAPAMAVGGGNVPEIVESTWDAITMLEELIADVDATVSRGLNQDMASAQAFASMGLELGRPDLIGGQGSFGDLTIPRDSSVPAQESLIVESIVDLHRAGSVNLPSAAALYDSAQALLDSCHLPGGVSGFFPRSAMVFGQAVDNLSGILARTSASLQESGHALVEVARTYQLTDEEMEEAMRRIGQISVPFLSGDDPNRALQVPV